MENKENFSFRKYIDSEFRRGYHIEYDRERFALRKEKIYTFFKIPFEVEKLIIFGYFHCADSFLFVITFLPIRFGVALLKFLYKYLCILFRKEHAQQQSLGNMETIDLLKGFLIGACCFAATYVDTSMIYHLIKTQSTVKLYIFYNMLEIADKLMSAFGQDTLDALFWTATAIKVRKRDYFLLFFNLLVSVIYISIHSGIVLLQALVLNVAVNSESKGLLTIVISNNFIEIKGSVFKKYDRNNLLQIACSDVRERFQHGVLIFVVIMLTMKEYSWKEAQLYDMAFVCGIIIVVEVFIDWLKHSFITRFNEIPVDVYQDYMLLLSSDLVMCKKQNAFSDHSDLVARGMGFTPLPLGVIVFRILSQTLKFNNLFSFFLLILGYLCLLTFRILNSILILAAASWYIESANSNRKKSESEGKDSAWRNAVDSYCERVHTPLRSRRRTISTEDNVEAVSKAMLDGMPVTTEDFNRRIPPEQNCDELDEDASGNSETSVGFLGESRAGLFSNSMLNLVEVGLDEPESDDEIEIRVADSGTDDSVVSADGTSFFEPLSSHAPVSTKCSTEIPEEGETVEPEELGEQTDVCESEILPILRKGVLVSDSNENLKPVNSENHY